MRLMREYRDAIDHICGIMETLCRLGTSNPLPSEDREVLSSLAIDRVRRFISFCLDVVADLDAGGIRPDSINVEELTRAIHDLSASPETTQQIHRWGKSVPPARITKFFAAPAAPGCDCFGCPFSRYELPLRS